MYQLLTDKGKILINNAPLDVILNITNIIRSVYYEGDLEIRRV